MSYWENDISIREFNLGPTAIEFAREQHEKGADIVDVKDVASGRIILTLTK